MKRKIITIDEELCNGCGQCVNACAEGALAMVNGKARLVKEQYCDGLGDCVGECPTGALRVVEIEAPAYDPVSTRQHVERLGGVEAVRRFDAVAQQHNLGNPPSGVVPQGFGGCPGTRMRMPTAAPTAAAVPTSGNGLPGSIQPSELRQWPIQLHLVSPGAPFFRNKELVLMSTCAPLASADVHWRFLRGRSVVVACPKLDDTDGYVEKLAAILADPTIPRVIVVRMEVPCCGGLMSLVAAGLSKSGRSDVEVEEVIVGVNGGVQAVERTRIRERG